MGSLLSIVAMLAVFIERMAVGCCDVVCRRLMRGAERTKDEYEIVKYM